MIYFIIILFLLPVFSLFTAVFAWVYAEILTEPEMLLNKPFCWINEHLPSYIAKPIMTCVFCVGGQIALWSYLITVWSTELNYNFIHHIVFISFTIFYIKIIDKSWQN